MITVAELISELEQLDPTLLVKDEYGHLLSAVSTLTEFLDGQRQDTHVQLEFGGAINLDWEEF
jgi:hypothetical protein